MAERTLDIQPRRRPKVAGFDAKPPGDGADVRADVAPIIDPAPAAKRPKAQVKKAVQRKKSHKTTPRPTLRSGARRRVHVTIGRQVADGVRARCADDDMTNTELFIEAFGAVGSSMTGPSAPVGPFAPRRRSGGREAWCVYLAPDEIAFVDAEATRLGFASRSAFFDAVLAAHLTP